MKFVISALTEVAEALRSEYEEKDGKFVLKLEGDYPPLLDANAKLVEFRDNNRALNSKVTKLETDLKKFEGIDPQEHAALKVKVSELEKGGIKNQDDVSKAIKEAVKAAVAPLEEDLRVRKESEAAAKAEAARERLENKLREAGIAGGIEERAISDFIARAQKVFKLIDGNIVPRKADNTPIFSRIKPAEELSLEEYTKDLRSEAPFLFKPSKGGGAGNAGGGVVVKQTISNDPLEFGKNLEGIAKGEVVVQD